MKTPYKIWLQAMKSGMGTTLVTQVATMRTCAYSKEAIPAGSYTLSLYAAPGRSLVDSIGTRRLYFSTQNSISVVKEIIRSRIYGQISKVPSDMIDRETGVELSGVIGNVWRSSVIIDGACDTSIRTQLCSLCGKAVSSTMPSCSDRNSNGSICISCVLYIFYGSLAMLPLDGMRQSFNAFQR